MTTLTTADGAWLTAHLDAVIDLWSEANGSGETAAAARRDIVARHATYPDATVAAAHDEHEELVGIVYGTRSVPGQWWYERVAPAVAADDDDRWLADHLAVCELAVAPRRRRQGVGDALLRRWLALAPVRAARAVLLSVRSDNGPARSLYRRHGFVTVVADLRFADDGPSFHVLGRDQVTAGA